MKPNTLTEQNDRTDAVAATNINTQGAPTEPVEWMLMEDDEKTASMPGMPGAKRKAHGSAERSDQHHAKRHKISLAARPVDLMED